MKIYYDHQLFSLQDAGGAARYFFELVKHLQALKPVQLEVVLGLNSSIYPFAKLANDQTRISSIHSRMSPGLYRYLANECIGLPGDVLRGKVDIYHPTLYRSSRIVRRRRMVVTHHDCTHERYPSLFRNARVVIENKRRLYRAADAIICVSESSRTDLICYHDVDPLKTHVIHHGFTPFESEIKSGRDRLRPTRPYILFVGNRGTYKNFLTLLEAFQRTGLFAAYDLLAVGGGKFTDAENARLAELKLSQQVRLVPRATEQTLAEAYRHAAVFVYPSLYEGFGFPPLEAMSLGCPVIASDTSSLPEICGTAAIYFNPEDAAELGRKLISVLTSQPSADAMRERGYSQTKLYDWHLAAARTLGVYEEVLKG